MKPVLEKDAEWLKKNPAVKIKIEGHCDERGSDEYNLALGDRRANSAKKYLANLGIDSNRISTISYGEEKPACKEANESCWSKNRRAEFVIVK
ncbi:MAG: peptidoglycan-associated lipoprotein Pal [Deltaproteobacteria bacterium]|nr:peptidoglycan-associated lipoprotein Pal [Deltaproteobacteria bacterium]